MIKTANNTRGVSRPIMRHVVLVGMMGVGKSTIGHLLARRSDRQFIDMDQLIENRQNRTITSIFQTMGERHFRQVEHETLRWTLMQPPSIIATGGGVFMFRRNRRLIRKWGVSVQLLSRPTVLWKRIHQDTGRPLLTGMGGLPHLQRLYNSRRAAYQTARTTVLISAGERPDAVVHRILNLLSEAGLQERWATPGHDPDR